jgi:gamma-glutamylcyclotransferase (GGCT)/AIG2-like uncharacterized protein YtfP
VSRVRYFAYGSNLDADQMRRRCASSRPRFRAKLPHHRLDFTHFSAKWLGGAADVLPQFGESVWGAVYELDGQEVPILDRFEGGYDRVPLTVWDDAGEPHAVISYTVRRKRTFLPTRTYLEKMILWADRWELPREYLAWLRAIRPLDGSVSRTTREPPRPR